MFPTHAPHGLSALGTLGTAFSHFPSHFPRFPRFPRGGSSLCRTWYGGPGGPSWQCPCLSARGDPWRTRGFGVIRARITIAWWPSFPKKRPACRYDYRLPEVGAVAGAWSSSQCGASPCARSCWEGSHPAARDGRLLSGGAPPGRIPSRRVPSAQVRSASAPSTWGGPHWGATQAVRSQSAPSARRSLPSGKLQMSGAKGGSPGSNQGPLSLNYLYLSPLDQTARLNR